MPGHASREILILFGSLTSCDPGDIHETLQVSINRTSIGPFDCKFSLWFTMVDRKNLTLDFIFKEASLNYQKRHTLKNLPCWQWKISKPLK